MTGKFPGSTILISAPGAICYLCPVFPSSVQGQSISFLSGRFSEMNTSLSNSKVASKPLFRDPVFDGAADPVVIWNRDERKWFMFYTNRRANVPDLPGVSWVYGSPVGIAESGDGGATWSYRGTTQIDAAQIPDSEGEDTLWAPDVLYHEGTYHMFLTFVPSVRTDWSGPRRMLHLTSKDLLQWEYQSTLELSSDRVIDASVLRVPDGTWRMFYNNETDGKSIYYADSPDLFTWRDGGKIVSERAGEGPKVFYWKNRYWMIVDHWCGFGVYHSTDTLNWTPQPQDILATPGQGEDDKVMGNHADVVVSDNRAFLFYFTHPGRQGIDSEQDTYEQRRSSIQVVELKYNAGEIEAERDQPTYIALQPPGGA
jgi:sucrose-6-phosphate hydrolase SacC (GH32 family)